MLQLGAMNINIPSSIHHRKTIDNHFAVSCNTKFSVCYNAWGSNCADNKDHVSFVHGSTKWLINTSYRRRPALNRLATTCNSMLSDKEEVSLKRRKADDMMMGAKFAEVYSVLKSELLNDPTFESTHDSRLWLHQMLDYNVPGGKLARGISVIDSYKSLKEGKELSENDVFDATVVGWCIEWLQACFLMHDDIMDNSHTRRGQPCWFRLPKVGRIAVNDGIILSTQIRRILKKHFREKPYYVDLLDLFNEVEFQTACGQMLDLITTTTREKDLSKYSLDLYRRIAQYKTGYYSFYLPVACALLMAGEDLERHVNVTNVLLDMGIYFQALDDYLDCFGDPEKTGKIGTDIEDFKCSWLIVKALELSNEEQKKILREHYGKASPNDVAKVKAVYNDINLRDVFLAFESVTYDKLKSCVEAHPSKAVQAIWARYTRNLDYYKKWL